MEESEKWLGNPIEGLESKKSETILYYDDDQFK